ncbi:MAG: ribonuclease E/G [Rhodospirillaceae bacterium]
MTLAMIPDTILVSRGPGETRFALTAGDDLIEVVHQRDGLLQQGAAYFARIGAPVPHMPAVFVNLGGAAAGVLKVKRPFPNEGRGVAVTVVVPERAGKGAEVKLAPDVAVPADGRAGLLLRAFDPAAKWFAAYGEAIAEIVCGSRAEAARLKTLLGGDAPITVHDATSDLFAARGIDDAIEAALEPNVPLPCGGSLIIESTAAVIAIDVNAGGAEPDTANREALAAVALELRRRNLAGHIVVDTIPTRQRRTLPPLLDGLIAGDPAQVKVAGLTPLGMIELTRQRLGLSLAETLCGDDGRPSAVSIAHRVLRAAVRFGFTQNAAHVKAEVAADVAAVLAGSLASAREEAEAALKGGIRIEARADFPRRRCDFGPA